MSAGWARIPLSAAPLQLDERMRGGGKTTQSLLETTATQKPTGHMGLTVGDAWELKGIMRDAGAWLGPPCSGVEYCTKTGICTAICISGTHEFDSKKAYQGQGSTDRQGTGHLVNDASFEKPANKAMHKAMCLESPVRLFLRNNEQNIFEYAGLVHFTDIDVGISGGQRRAGVNDGAYTCHATCCCCCCCCR